MVQNRLACFLASSDAATALSLHHSPPLFNRHFGSPLQVKRLHAIDRLEFLSLGLVRLQTAYRHQLAHDEILFLKPLLPPAQSLHLLPIQILQGVQGAIEVLGQHVLVEAATCQPATRIAPRKVGVGPARPVEIAARGDVKDAAAHGQVDGHAVEAVVGEERGGREGAEDCWWGCAGEGLWRRGLEAQVDEDSEEGEEDEVDGSGYCGDGSRWWRLDGLWHAAWWQCVGHVEMDRLAVWWWSEWQRVVVVP